MQLRNYVPYFAGKERNVWSSLTCQQHSACKIHLLEGHALEHGCMRMHDGFCQSEDFLQQQATVAASVITDRELTSSSSRPL